MPPRHTERSTLAACVAQVLGVAAADVPLGADDLPAWLAERGLGLVPIADAASFSWAGPWIGWRAADADDIGTERRAVVMFGVPSGVLWDPAGTAGPILDGALVAPLDVATWSPPPTPAQLGTGVVEAIVLAPRAEAPVRRVEEARAIAGTGLEGDRYAAGRGTWPTGRPGGALTLVDAAVLEELAGERGAPIDHRRNLVVRGIDLNALVGRRFAVGEVVCRGRRLCEPCAHLDRLNDGGVLRPLVHRGGLRADIEAGGMLHVGDLVVAQADDDRRA